MMSFDDARILDMEEITAWDGKEMWLLTRGNMASWPVIYDHEQIPYLVFKTIVGKSFYMLRPALMLKTWVMFDKRPSAGLRRSTFVPGKAVEV